MINRRSMLGAMVAAAGVGVNPAAVLATQGKQKRPLPWRNWSGSQHCLPLARKAPASIEELRELIAASKGILRPVGAGHSFTPLVPTNGTIVSLSRMSGLISHKSESLQATLWAGSRLGDIGQPLEDVGQALENMPDIDQQALAGCLATATHGTGADIGCMSTFVTGLELVDAAGNIHRCSADNNAELFSAAKVSLGALGFITSVTVQNVAPYRLKRETVWRDFDEILEVADDLASNNRNFEFYYIPFTGMGFTDVHNFTDEPIGATDKIDSNDAARDLKVARDWMRDYPWLRELVLGSYMKTLSDEVTIESSWKNYANERNVRFNEMEYHLPRDNAFDALREIRKALESHHHEVFFPIEFRYIKGDDIWLSPFYQRDSCSIAVHRFFEEDFKPYFKTIEPILLKHGGRPHWGKLNTLGKKELSGLYPRWDEFLAVRQEIDPQGRFLNDYLRRIFT